MTTTEPTTEEAALWASIGEMPECQLRRGVAADWFEERSGTVECPNCAPPRAFPPYAWKCPTCQGTGYIPDRNGRMAAALRATVKAVPVQARGLGLAYLPEWRWFRRDIGFVQGLGDLQPDVFDRLAGGEINDGGWCYFYRPVATAAAAIRDLCEAWRKVNYGEVRE